MNSPYSPSREQIIQLVTTLLTLMISILLGPMIGENAGVIQSMVKQVVPFLVAASVHFAADRTMPKQPIEAPITSVQLQPVQVTPSPIGQTF